jgi:aspartate/methionine/tyrosine aminotransferase
MIKSTLYFLQEQPNLFFPTLALVQQGDEVIYPKPGFPTYAAMIGVAGGIAVPVPLLEENDFSFDLEAIGTLMLCRLKEEDRDSFVS